MQIKIPELVKNKSWYYPLKCSIISNNKQSNLRRIHHWNLKTDLLVNYYMN